MTREPKTDQAIPGHLAAIFWLLCPRCRWGRVFRGRFSMNDRCANCDLKFEREPGYFVGSMYVSYVLAVPTLSAIALMAHLLRPEWSLGLVLAVSSLGLVPLSPGLFRYSRVIWLHLDQTFDPI